MEGLSDNVHPEGADLLQRKQVGKLMDTSLLKAYCIASRIEYDSFNEPDYIKVRFNEATGGYEIRAASHLLQEATTIGEREVIDRLVANGDRIIVSLTKYGQKNPDLNLNGKFHEIKVQEGNNLKRFFVNRFKQAALQSRNIIFRISQDATDYYIRQRLRNYQDKDNWDTCLIIMPETLQM